MFRAVNTESESERRKAHLERKKIQSTYLSALKSMNLAKMFSMEIRYEQNHGLFCNAKSNLLCSFIRKTPTDQLLGEIEAYGILESKSAFFEVVRKFIEEGNFIRAHKLLNLAQSKGWVNNDYFELREEISRKYIASIRPRRPC